MHGVMVGWCCETAVYNTAYTDCIRLGVSVDLADMAIIALLLLGVCIAASHTFISQFTDLQNHAAMWFPKIPYYKFGPCIGWQIIIDLTRTNLPYLHKKARYRI